MFTGLIETTGTVKRIGGSARKTRLSIQPKKCLSAVRVGESVSVNGVCLTVAGIRGGGLAFDAVAETLRKTTLGALRAGSVVNLERALRYGDRLGGHCVTGHIEAVGRVMSLEKKSRERVLAIRMPRALRSAVIPKGSIALDGVSLTLGEVGRENFKVYLIPHTLRETTLGTLKPGDPVNLETDILIRAILASGSSGKITLPSKAQLQRLLG